MSAGQFSESDVARAGDGKFAHRATAEADVDLSLDTPAPEATGYVEDDEIRGLRADFDAAFIDLKDAGLESDADDLVAQRYREASKAVNHANRKRDFYIATNTPYVSREPR